MVDVACDGHGRDLCALLIGMGAMRACKWRMRGSEHVGHEEDEKDGTVKLLKIAPGGYQHHSHPSGMHNLPAQACDKIGQSTLRSQIHVAKKSVEDDRRVNRINRTGVD